MNLHSPKGYHLSMKSQLKGSSVQCTESNGNQSFKLNSTPGTRIELVDNLFLRQMTSDAGEQLTLLDRSGPVSILSQHSLCSSNPFSNIMSGNFELFDNGISLLL
ncbi:hypothetical protein AVEN_142077-1 [Araneus ventricosus]|uniref:Uncharacterized protein n=1 Tax=Araneus ventricosus TaxID=182803 RepID=A0A4Y2M7D1_ARAVE|nr:hypothetical protein AVEN_142077-1 [Araneus ventricosus]